MIHPLQNYVESLNLKILKICKDFNTQYSHLHHGEVDEVIRASLIGCTLAVLFDTLSHNAAIESLDKAKELLTKRYDKEKH